MAKIEKFEDIQAWQRARELNRRIYRITRDGQFVKDFNLIDQKCCNLNNVQYSRGIC